MKSSVVFGIFSMILLGSDAQEELSIESFLRILSPRNPELHMVRRIEDANGDPYAVLDTIGLIERHGYPAEQHNFTTKDGYNIVIFRVPGSPKSPPKKGKPVAFVQHGMLSSSDCFVMTAPEEALGLILADAGYDVWLGNVRGNTYCRSHTNLTVEDKEFWNFSWHEMALMDVSGAIDYALEFTGQDSLYYVGHSMGTTMPFVLLSEKPEYNAKVRVVVALAPSGFWRSNPSIGWQMLINFAPVIKNLADSAKIYSVLPQTKQYAMMTELFCGEDAPTESLCIASIMLSFPIFVGAPADGFNPRALRPLLRHFPCGTSTKTLMHYQQCIQSGAFKKFDNGPAMNLRIYGTKTPPSYDLSRISAPMALIYGNTDVLSSPENVREFSKRFPSLITVEAVPAAKFNHFDFVASTRVKDLLYNRILEIFSKY